MELLDVIKRPVVAERSMLAMDKKEYTSKSDTRTNKTLIRQAVESAFDVEVASVNILDVRPKFKRMGKYVGHTKKRHKTIITLAEDSKEIQLLEAAK